MVARPMFLSNFMAEGLRGVGSEPEEEAFEARDIKLTWTQIEALLEMIGVDRLRIRWLNRYSFTPRIEDAQGAPTQSHTSPIILIYKDY
jgi:hypothetical protein